MSIFPSRVFNIADINGWNLRGELKLSPKYQRRSVWSEKAKSYLMDTIIRGKPLPKLFIREFIDVNGKQTREVIDGQQRVRSILDYIDNGFCISKVHNSEVGGLLFRDLPENYKKKVYKYVLTFDIFQDLPDEEIRDIFARLNTYNVSLNPQELRNAKYFGYFKQKVYDYSKEYSKFYLENCILTERQMNRMAEAEMLSELLIAGIDGIQSKKVIESYYKKYENNPIPNSSHLDNAFRKCTDIIGNVFEERLADSYFSRPHLFYTLFCVIYDLEFGLSSNSPKGKIRSTDIPKIRVCLDEISSKLEAKDDRYVAFLESLHRATTDTTVRKYRHKFILDKLLAVCR